MNVFSLHHVFLFVSFKKKNINTQNQCTIELLKKCAYLTKEIILYIFYSLLIHLLQENVILLYFSEQAYANLLRKLCLFCIKYIGLI